MVWRCALKKGGSSSMAHLISPMALCSSCVCSMLSAVRRNVSALEARKT